MPSRDASPAGSSMTYFAAPFSFGIASSAIDGGAGGTLRKTVRTCPSAETKTMSSGTSVFFIQNATGPSEPKTKSIPVCGASDVRYMSPRSCCSGVTATSSRTSADGACTTMTGSDEPARAAPAVRHAAAAAMAASLTLNRFDIVPVTPGFQGHFERNGEFHRRLHVISHETGDVVQLCGGDFKD